MADTLAVQLLDALIDAEQTLHDGEDPEYGYSECETCNLIRKAEKELGRPDSFADFE